MTREEMLAVAKPILFNTDMVRAIKDNRKTVTRRAVKPQPPAGAYVSNHYGDTWTWARWPDSQYNRLIKNIYYPGDILYVPEAWRCTERCTSDFYEIEFRDGEKVKVDFTSETRRQKWLKYIDKPRENWQSPYFMPKEAARLFLRVQDVRVERLQEITEEQAKAEGAVKAYPYIDQITREIEYMESEHGTYLAGFECLWNKCYAAPRGVKGEHGMITHYESYPFEEIREIRTYKGKPWYILGNPWVWGYEFEKMEAENA